MSFLCCAYHPRSLPPSRLHFLLFSLSLHAPQCLPLKDLQSTLSCSRAILRQYCPRLHKIISSSEISASLTMRSSGSESCSSELSCSRVFFFLIYLLYFCLFFPLFFLLFSPIYAREVMSCYVGKFPGGIRNQEWQGGWIATTRDETFWGV